jgi:hypothetical protein
LIEVEKICKELCKVDGEFDPDNPVTYLMEDPKTGKLKSDVVDERVVSAVIEFKTSLEKSVDVVRALERASEKVDTVFTVGVISRVEDDGRIPVAKRFVDQGIGIRPNGKTTLNLGRA